MSPGDSGAARDIFEPSGPSSEREVPAGSDISRAPTAFDSAVDRAFRRCTLAVACFTVLLVFWLVFSISRQAMPSFRAYGLSFLTGTEWDSNRAHFGILPAIVGTLYSSILGLAIGTAFGLAIAIFLSEGFLSSGLDSALGLLRLSDYSWLSSLPGRVENVLKITVELLAAIPSVVYGLWGIFVVIPFVRPPANWLHSHMGWIPLFGTGLAGPDFFPPRSGLRSMFFP